MALLADFKAQCWFCLFWTSTSSSLDFYKSRTWPPWLYIGGYSRGRGYSEKATSPPPLHTHVPLEPPQVPLITAGPHVSRKCPSASRDTGERLRPPRGSWAAIKMQGGYRHRLCEYGLNLSIFGPFTPWTQTILMTIWHMHDLYLFPSFNSSIACFYLQ